MQAFSSEELSAAKEQLEISSHLQQNLEKLWKGTRWIMDLITFARRDKFLRPPVSVASLFLQQGSLPTTGASSSPPSPLQPAAPIPSSSSLSSSPAHQQGAVREHRSSQSSSDDGCSSNEISVGKDQRRIAKFYDPSDDAEDSGDAVRDTCENSCPADSKDTGVKDREGSPMTSGILRVYAAYDTGLSKGVSVKLHITVHTTARDVVNLVVRHLNMALLDKGCRGPVHADDDLDNFCLVAVIGSRERVLEDDQFPLRLQNPWLKGRLYVRMVSSVIQQGQATAV